MHTICRRFARASRTDRGAYSYAFSEALLFVLHFAASVPAVSVENMLLVHLDKERGYKGIHVHGRWPDRNFI